MNETCNRQSAQCGPLNTGPWLADLSHRICHSSPWSLWSLWSHCLTNQASQTLDVRPRMQHLPSFAGDRLGAKTQSCTASSADAIHRQHRELPQEAAKNAGFNPENESKNPDKSGNFRPNPGKSGQIGPKNENPKNTRSRRRRPMTKNLTSAKGNGSSSFFLHPSSLSTQGWPSSRADRCPIIEMRPIPIPSHCRIEFLPPQGYQCPGAFEIVQHSVALDAGFCPAGPGRQARRPLLLRADGA